MQLAKIVLPDPGDPLIKNPLLGDSLLIFLQYQSFNIKLKSSDSILWQTSEIPPRFLNLQLSLSWNSMRNQFFLIFLDGFLSKSTSAISLSFCPSYGLGVTPIFFVLKNATVPDFIAALFILLIVFDSIIFSTILSESSSGYLEMNSQITFLSSGLIMNSLFELAFFILVINMTVEY